MKIRKHGEVLIPKISDEIDGNHPVITFAEEQVSPPWIIVPYKNGPDETEVVAVCNFDIILESGKEGRSSHNLMDLVAYNAGQTKELCHVCKR